MLCALLRGGLLVITEIGLLVAHHSTMRLELHRHFHAGGLAFAGSSLTVRFAQQGKIKLASLRRYGFSRG